MTPLSFHAEERLKSHSTIGRLFNEGHSFSVYPLRVVWLPVSAPSGAYPAQFALTVPRRSFKKAVQRNPLRRRIREAYRLHKAPFYQQISQQEDQQIALMVIYVAREALPYATIAKAMKRLLKRLVRELTT